MSGHDRSTLHRLIIPGSPSTTRDFLSFRHNRTFRVVGIGSLSQLQVFDNVPYRAARVFGDRQ